MDTTDHVKNAIRSHTNDFLSGKYPFLHMTPDNEKTYVEGYLSGLSKGIDIAKGIINEAPTVFLQEEKKEPEY